MMSYATCVSEWMKIKWNEMRWYDHAIIALTLFTFRCMLWTMCWKRRVEGRLMSSGMWCNVVWYLTFQRDILPPPSGYMNSDYSLTLMKKATSSFETLVYIYHTTKLTYQGRNMHSHCPGNQNLATVNACIPMQLTNFLYCSFAVLHYHIIQR